MVEDASPSIATLENSKPPKDKLSKNKRKVLKELQSDTSIVILLANKGKATVTLNREWPISITYSWVRNRRPSPNPAANFLRMYTKTVLLQKMNNEPNQNAGVPRLIPEKQWLKKTV